MQNPFAVGPPLLLHEGGGSTAPGRSLTAAHPRLARSSPPPLFARPVVDGGLVSLLALFITSHRAIKTGRQSRHPLSLILPALSDPEPKQIPAYWSSPRWSRGLAGALPTRSAGTPVPHPAERTTRHLTLGVRAVSRGPGRVDRPWPGGPRCRRMPRPWRRPLCHRWLPNRPPPVTNRALLPAQLLRWRAPAPRPGVLLRRRSSSGLASLLRATPPPPRSPLSFSLRMTGLLLLPNIASLLSSIVIFPHPLPLLLERDPVMHSANS
jgi:hypothetical protein